MLTCSAVFVGDSIMAGNHTPGHEIPTLVGISIPSIVIHNIAVPSSSIDNAGQAAAADALIDVTKEINICAVMFGANDLASLSGSAFEATLKSFCLARRIAGFKIVVCTVLPLGGYDINPKRAVANSATRTDPTFWDAMADWGNTATTMGADLAWQDATLYNAADLVHPTNHGNDLLEPFLTNAILDLLNPVIVTGSGIPRSRMFTGM